jgi:hypothetical protein
VLFIGSPHSHFSYSCSDIKMWCWDDKSHTSSASIVHQPAVRLVMPPYLHLVAVPWGTLTLAESAPEVQEALGANGTSLGAVSVEVDGASLQPDDDIGGLLRDWVMFTVGIGAPGTTTSGDAIPAPGSSSAAGPWVSELLLLASPGFLPSPIDWR